MSDIAFADLSEQVMALSYDQTIVLMTKMLENLKRKKSEDDYDELVKMVTEKSMKTTWEALKDDTW